MAKETKDYGHRLKAFSLRMENELRSDLEEVCEANGRTLTSEINNRLINSFHEEKQKDARIDELLALVREMSEKLNNGVSVRRKVSK